jgi:competence ComEA-like helix-hairpin-helix protein
MKYKIFEKGGQQMKHKKTNINHQYIHCLFHLIMALVITQVLAANVSAEEKILKGKTVNINTATVEEFMQVPLITKELAKAIVEYREEAGEFQVIEELLQVDGFDRTLLRKIKGFLLLEGIGGDECTC